MPSTNARTTSWGDPIDLRPPAASHEAGTLTRAATGTAKPSVAAARLCHTGGGVAYRPIDVPRLEAESMTCTACGTDNITRGKFCNGCGVELVMACPRCGFSNPPAARFCGDCATSLGATGSPSPSEAERRQLTVLFCDLVGSTELSERLDPEDLREVVQNYHAAASQVIRELDGYVAQYLGDGILAYFGYPLAHENDARRAILAGLGIIRIIRAVSGVGMRLPGACAVQLQVRIGIHTGPVVLGSIGGHQRQERLALGETPNLAARLQSVAEPDTLVISAATHRLTRGFFECQGIGARTLKGISQPLELHRVIGERQVSSRVASITLGGLTPFVGRTEELALLERCLACGS